MARARPRSCRPSVGCWRRCPARSSSTASRSVAWTQRIVDLGIAHVPEGRRLFAAMSVRDQLKLAAFRRNDRGAVDADIEHVLELFPRLRERLHQLGGHLSGGEQQMAAIARGLMARPRLLMIDELLARIGARPGRAPDGGHQPVERRRHDRVDRGARRPVRARARTIAAMSSSPVRWRSAAPPPSCWRTRGSARRISASEIYWTTTWPSIQGCGLQVNV